MMQYFFFLEKYLIYKQSHSKATHLINAHLFHLGMDLGFSKLNMVRVGNIYMIYIEYLFHRSDRTIDSIVSNHTNLNIFR